METEIFSLKQLMLLDREGRETVWKFARDPEARKSEEREPGGREAAEPGKAQETENSLGAEKTSGVGRSFTEMVTAHMDNAHVAVKVMREDGLYALELEALLRPGKPAYGFQNAFCEQKGVSLVLTPRWEVPFMAVYQHKEWWLRPAFGSRFSEIPGKTQLLIFQNREWFVCFLAVCGRQNRADLEGCPEGIHLTMSLNQASQHKISDCAMVCGCGRDPYELTERMVALALKLSGKTQTMRKEKLFPTIFGKIGWCTWDSLGQDVNEKAIFEKMEEFREKNIPIDWVLIDDGWSGCNQERQTLVSLEADTEKFPHGLAGTIRGLKEKYHVAHVGVWQAVKGYWNGIEPGSEAELEMKEYIKRYPNGELSVRADVASSFGFWSTWHSGLRKAGVDFVKVDEQSSFSLLLRGSESYGALAGIHTGLEASVALYFDGSMINCMGMAPEDVWNRQNTALSRCSDDFTPTVPGSFAEHVLQNCYNSILHGCLYWGDWDMVWSMHPEARQNILLRILSGGPFYLSDALHHSDPAEIEPVILPDGTVTRCQDVARPTLDCVTDARVLREKPLKIYNQYEKTIYLAVFSPSKTADGYECDHRESETEMEPEFTDVIRKTDFPDLPWERYWIFDWRTREATLCENGMSYEVKLPSGDAALYHIIPLETVSVIGILEKYISGACVRHVTEEQEDLLFQTECGGTFAFLTEIAVEGVWVDGRKTIFERMGSLVTFPVDRNCAFVRIRIACDSGEKKTE